MRTRMTIVVEEASYAHVPTARMSYAHVSAFESWLEYLRHFVCIYFSSQTYRIYIRWAAKFLLLVMGLQPDVKGLQPNPGQSRRRIV